MTLAFSEAEYAARHDHALARLSEAGLDALVVTQPENIAYLSGYWTPGYHVFQAMVIRRSGDPFLVVRNIEVDNVRERSWFSRCHPINNLDLAIDIFLDALRAEGLTQGVVGVEVDGARQSMTRLDLLAAGMPGIEWRPSLDLVEPLRATKSPAEIAYIRRAVAMAESALVAGARASHPGNTDSDVAAEVAAELARQGSEFTGSPPYVVGGAASASSHAIHARRPLQPHEPMWLEISASVERYQGVTSRIAGTDALSAEARRHFDISASAIRAMLGAMRPGVTAGAVDAAGRAAVDRHGLGHLWKNRAAYSLGLSFPPGLGEGHIIDLKPGDIRLLKANMVFHLIPILKVPGVGAIGCTETVMVSEDGGVRLGSLDMVPLTPETLK